MVTQTTTTGAKKGPAQLSLPVVRRLLFLLMLGVLGTPAVAVEDAVHQKCLQAADYKGCVEVLGGGGTSSSIKALSDAMRMVSSRLQSGVSLRDLPDTFRPVIDAYAVVQGSEKSSPVYAAAGTANKLYGLLKSLWRERIDSAHYGSYGYEGYLDSHCRKFMGKIIVFNSLINPDEIAWDWRKKKWGVGACEFDIYPEIVMYRYLTRFLRTSASLSEARIPAPALDPLSDFRSSPNSSVNEDPNAPYVNPNTPPPGGCNKYGICDY